MKKTRRAALAMVSIMMLAGIPAAEVRAQAGKGLIDPNVATESQLRSLPHMTPAVAKSMMEKRPFLSALDLNAFLLSQNLMPQQAAEIYRKAFVQINLNTGTREEFLLIPGAGSRMAREFA